MITNFKFFESVSESPKIGDYVILDSDLFQYHKLFCNFIDSNIGQVINTKNVKKSYRYEKYVIVKFENVPKKLSFYEDNFFEKNNTRVCSIGTLKCWSSDKEELEEFITVKKYNL